MALQDLSKNPSSSFFGLFGSIFIDDVFRQGRNQNYRELLQLFILSLIFLLPFVRLESHTLVMMVSLLYLDKNSQRGTRKYFPTNTTQKQKFFSSFCVSTHIVWKYHKIQGFVWVIMYLIKHHSKILDVKHSWNSLLSRNNFNDQRKCT